MLLAEVSVFAFAGKYKHSQTLSHIIPLYATPINRCCVGLPFVLFLAAALFLTLFFLAAALFLLAALLAVIPVPDIFAAVIAEAVAVDLFVITGIVVKTPLAHLRSPHSFRTYNSISYAADFFAAFLEEAVAEKYSSSSAISHTQVQTGFPFSSYSFWKS